MRGILTLLVMAFSVPCAHAHPHVFISNRVAVDFDGATLATISVEWSFDELFSQMILADYDAGAKGSFTEAEERALKKGAFDNLRNFHYFLDFYLNGTRLNLPPIQDFKPTIRGGKLVYSFSVPLALQVPAKQAELRITIYDDTYYVAFDRTLPDDIAIRNAGSVEAAVSIETTKVKAEWPGQFMPDQVVLRMRRK